MRENVQGQKQCSSKIPIDRTYTAGKQSLCERSEEYHYYPYYNDYADFSLHLGLLSFLRGNSGTQFPFKTWSPFGRLRK